MGIIIDASMDLSIPTNIRETPAPNIQEPNMLYTTAAPITAPII